MGIDRASASARSRSLAQQPPWPDPPVPLSGGADRPLPPVVAARAVSEAARAVADAWAPLLDLAGFSLALSQLRSILRDLGVATRGLARYQTAGNPADPAPPDFPQLLEASAQRLLDIEVSLDDVVVAEGLGPVPDPDEPGAVLCCAARSAITSWRQPTGTSIERNATVEQLIAAVEFLAAAALSLAEYAPRRRAIDLRASAASLSEVTACLSKSIPPAQRTGGSGPLRTAMPRLRQNVR
jgi:hypothetical protein